MFLVKKSSELSRIVPNCSRGQSWGKLRVPENVQKAQYRSDSIIKENDTLPVLGISQVRICYLRKKFSSK